MSKTLPDQIADLLISLIFTGDLRVGEKLPPERQLAEFLDVDRTSLRMALRTLGRMNAVRSVQGSGIRVGDVRRDMGLDFLDNLYRIPELELGGELLLAGLELFNRAIPTAIRLALEKRERSGGSPEDAVIPQLVQRMYQGLNEGMPMSDLADLEVEMIDTIMTATGNLVLQASSTSSRRIRSLLTQKLFEQIDVRAHLDHQVQMLMRTQQGDYRLDEMIQQYQQYIDTLTKPLREHLNNIPEQPRLLRSPLHNGRNIISLRHITGSS